MDIQELVRHLLDQMHSKFVYSCPFFEITGLLCPGCGGTRSLKALLFGHLLTAIHENPAVPLMALLLLMDILQYFVPCVESWRKKLIDSSLFWKIVVVIWLLWAVLRNLISFLQPWT